MSLALFGCASNEHADLYNEFELLTQESDIATRYFDSHWWTAFDDDSINTLVRLSTSNNPTLLEALASIDDANAQLSISQSMLKPSLTLQASATGSSDGSSNPKEATQYSIGPAVSWEIDIFDRIGSSTLAATSHLNANTVAANIVKRSIQYNTVISVIDYRTCKLIRNSLEQTYKSELLKKNLYNKKFEVGLIGENEITALDSDMITAKIAIEQQDESCQKQLHAISALTGIDDQVVRKHLDTSFNNSPYLSKLSNIPDKINASVLLTFPNVKLAVYKLESALAGVSYAEASRRPRLNISAILTGNWINTVGQTIDYTSSSLELSSSWLIFDGGSGKANVDAALAKYKQQKSLLINELRITEQDIKDTLIVNTQINKECTDRLIQLDKAKKYLSYSTQLLNNGFISQITQEENKQKLFEAQRSVFIANRDKIKAWAKYHHLLGIEVKNVRVSNDES